MHTLGDYQIQRPIGEGPFGRVYLVEHRFLKRPFALKELPEEIAQDPVSFARFEEEIGKIAALDHPHIAKIHNVSVDQGKPYLVTDPVVDSFGQTIHLERFLELKGSSLSEEEMESLLRQVAGALEFAHEKGCIHGGLKLTNLLVAPSESGVKLLLSDFGLVRLLGEERYLGRLTARSALKALPFLAPEQKWQGRSEATADRYAFGVLAYHLLVRMFPEGAYPLPSKIYPESSRNWDLFLSSLLQVDPGKRVDLKKAFEALAHEVKKGERVHLSDLELEQVLQMSFEFIPEQAAAKPVLKAPEIARPEFEPDPGAIFQRELHVSHYTPQTTQVEAIEPLHTEMVVIPGGVYERGSNQGARDEMPRHPVTLSSFALDIHPVTNEQFLRFLLAMGGEKDQNNNDIIRLRDSRIKRSGGKLVIESGYAKHPVVGVSWYGALAYAKWLGKRLPTEAEWEAASGGGKETLYPYGDEIERTQANFFSSDTTPVQSYRANHFGLYDMAGNVYNWCQDWYAYNYYDASMAEPINPQGPHQGVYRVLRGGCWKSLKEDLRVSHRHRNNPGAMNGTYGFRCGSDVTVS
jgi:formylglycine-generating enzyme required for sulfatase activity